MSTDTLELPALTDQERVDLLALSARHDVLARSEFNRRAHLLIEDARVFAERVESFLCDFEDDEAKKLLTAAFPDDEHIPGPAVRWGTQTFGGVHSLFSQLVDDVTNFLAVSRCDLPPLPTDKEVNRG